jgi:PTS system mannose-specific IID component
MSKETQRVELRKIDLIKHWLLGYSSETCYNYERLQALGTTNAMMPIFKRLYTKKEDIADAMKRYMVFFNTEPSFFGTVIHGIAASMEEQKANGMEISGEDINSVRTGLMGPMAGIGDTVSQGIVYPVLAGIACSLALAGNVAGPIMFEVVYKAIMLGMGYSMYMMGYKQGKSAILNILQSGKLNKITELFAVLGLMVVGSMAATRVGVVIPLEFNTGADVVVNVQSVLDSLMPGLLPLLITMGIWKLVDKKTKPTVIILVLFLIGIIGSYLGILGVPA